MRVWPLLVLSSCLIAPAANVDPNLSYRTDAANEHLPWYRLKPGEFPPLGSEHVVDGVLVEADFIHRSGQFRTVGDGKLVDFTMPPFGTVLYLDTEADLRDVPLGTLLHFSTYQDARGEFTVVAAIRDDFTNQARDGFTYRLEDNKAGEGKLMVTGPSGRSELAVDGQTRVWKGNEPAKSGDLAVGEELRVNFTGQGRCAEVWAGKEAHELATSRQRKRQNTFLKERGLACWIDHIRGKKLTVTLFGDPSSLRGLLKDEGIDPALWARERRRIEAAVANEELRTYNPPVDRKGSLVLTLEEISEPGHGCGGVRWVIEPELLLEGFRKGRVIRLFAQPSWPVNDMPFGEGLYSEAPDYKPDRIDPNLYPYRIDSGNEDLPWYRPKPGEFPPLHSGHEVVGELVKVDDHGRSGRFRADRTGELVDFTMPPFGTVAYLNAEAELGDVPVGTRCRLTLHQDDRGAFTRAAVIEDEFTSLAGKGLAYRLDEARLDEGRLLAAKRHAPVKNDKEEMIRPPDFGREEFAVDDRTRVWKGMRPATLRDLEAGDELLVNTTGRTSTSRGICTDIWAGPETIKWATERQRANYNASSKGRGLPAWIEGVEGKAISIIFFAGNRKDFPKLLDGDPGGEVVRALLADDDLRPVGGEAVKLAFRTHLPEGKTAGTYGCSGVRWLIEATELPEGFRPGRPVRVFKPGWPIGADASAR